MNALVVMDRVTKGSCQCDDCSLCTHRFELASCIFRLGCEIAFIVGIDQSCYLLVVLVQLQESRLLRWLLKPACAPPAEDWLSVCMRFVLAKRITKQ